MEPLTFRLVSNWEEAKKDYNKMPSDGTRVTKIRLPRAV